jgi:histone-binding protein RBBP4
LKEHRLLLGTNTSGKDKESIIIARVNMPTRSETDPRDYNVDLGEVGGYGSTVDVFKWEIIQTMQHPGEVNKARYMPQNPEIIASMVGSGSDDVKSGTVLIFDRTKHPLKPTSFNPQMQLVGHTQEGYGLSWNPKQEGILASASNDKTVRLWNIKDGFSKKNANNHPSERTLTHHTAPVNDVEFHPRDPNILASVSDDRTLQIIDLRGNKPAMKIQAHADSVNCLNWHPDASFNHVILTGSSDNSIGLWDPRRGQKGKLHSFESHNDDVIRVEWNPHCISMFASASYDRRVCIWDVSKIGGEQEQQDSEDAPPEM